MGQGPFGGRATVHDTPFGRVYVRTFGLGSGLGHRPQPLRRSRPAGRPVQRRRGSPILFWIIALFLLMMLFG